MQLEQSRQVSPRSRAQALRDKVEIRLAVNEAGSLIAEVLEDNGITLPGADWSKVFPHWLIATVDDEVIGCCQMLIATPVGFVEFLCVKPSAPFKLRAIAVRKLLIQGMNALYHAGCAYVGGAVDVKNRKFADVLTRLDFTKVRTADTFARRLR